MVKPLVVGCLEQVTDIFADLIGGAELIGKPLCNVLIHGLEDVLHEGAPGISRVHPQVLESQSNSGGVNPQSLGNGAKGHPHIVHAEDVAIRSLAVRSVYVGHSGIS